MNNPKFTAGPWKVDKMHPGMVRINNDPMCGILVGLRDNAQLISAAPDLYEALKAVQWRGFGTYEPTCPACRQMISDGHASDCTINAALKKAVGEYE